LIWLTGAGGMFGAPQGQATIGSTSMPFGATIGIATVGSPCSFLVKRYIVNASFMEMDLPGGAPSPMVHRRAVDL